MAEETAEEEVESTEPEEESPYTTLSDAADAALGVNEVKVGPWMVATKRVNVGPSVIHGLIALGGSADTQLLAFGAALGVMWENNTSGPRYPLRTQYKKLGRKWTEYGAKVVDELVGRGVPMAEIYAAGYVVWLQMFKASELWPSAKDIEDAVGNSPAS